MLTSTVSLPKQEILPHGMTRSSHLPKPKVLQSNRTTMAEMQPEQMSMMISLIKPSRFPSQVLMTSLFRNLFMLNFSMIKNLFSAKNAFAVLYDRKKIFMRRVFSARKNRKGSLLFLLLHVRKAFYRSRRIFRPAFV